MTRRAGLTRAVAALGLVLLGPELLIVSTSRTAARLRERVPRLERALAAAVDVLSRDALSCRDTPAQPARLSASQLRDAQAELVEAHGALGMAVFSLHAPAATQAVAWGLPGTRGLDALNLAQRELGGVIQEFQLRHPVCQRTAHLDAEGLRAEEQRSAGEVAEYVARLSPFARDLDTARRALDADLPVLAGLAWTLGAVVVVGCALSLVGLRQVLLARRAGRGARGSGLNATARGVRLVAALGLILLGPAILIVPAHQAAERLRERHPPVALALEGALDVLTADAMVCLDVPAGSRALSPERLWRAHRRLAEGCHALGGAAFSTDDDLVFSAIAWRAPGTGGLAESYQVWLDLSDITLAFDVRPICQGADHLDAGGLRDEERRSAAEVAAYRARLAPFVQRLGAARAALERDRPVLVATAWSLGIIEVVGWALFLVVLRQEYRAWRARRGPGPRPQA